MKSHLLALAFVVASSSPAPGMCNRPVVDATGHPVSGERWAVYWGKTLATLWEGFDGYMREDPHRPFGPFNCEHVTWCAALPCVLEADVPAGDPRRHETCAYDALPNECPPPGAIYCVNWLLFGSPPETVP